MAFKTKLDYSNNRQIKQHIETLTILSGATSFGVPFSYLPTGPDFSTSAITETYTLLGSTFSGNSGTTIYSWYDPRMQLGASALSALTPSNSGTVQTTGIIFTANSTTTIDGNNVVLSYSGVSFSIDSIAMISLGGGNYSGTVSTNILNILSANTTDFTGRTIWVDVSGITRTNDLIINKNPQINYVWTCIDLEGKGSWMPSSGGTSGGSGTDIYVTGGTYSSGTAVFRNNTGGTFSVTGFTTGSSVTLPSTQIGYGSTGNTLTSSLNLTYDDSANSFTAKTGTSGKLVVRNWISVGDPYTALYMGSQTPNSSNFTMLSDGSSIVYINTPGGGVGAVNFQSIGIPTAKYKTDRWNYSVGVLFGDVVTGSFDLVGTPTAFVDINTATTTTAQLRIRSSIPNSGITSPQSGMINNDGTNLWAYLGGSWKQLDNVTGATSYWSASTGSNSIVPIFSNSVASAQNALAEGFQTTAGGPYSHAEGFQTTATELSTHAEGYRTTASGQYSHAEGVDTISSASASHAEGSATTASGLYSHASGSKGVAVGVGSFVHGNSIASGITTVVLGDGLTGIRDNTTYVNELNIRSVGAGPSLIDIGIDNNNFVVNVASDIRLKENILPIDNALQRVKSLNGVFYNWKDRSSGGDSKKIGFIAQQVEPIVPELVYTNSDGFKTVHYKDVTALLVEAIKELSSAYTKNTDFLETQTILAEDNNIDLNYSGNSTTSIGGGIRVLHALGEGSPAELIIDEDGNWTTNNGFKPKKLSIPIYTPSSSNDVNGNEGEITTDNDFLYVKTNNKWKRIKLEEF